ncbi:SDR family NAD(P)-dependent oxidoreductase, partial [Chloroflexota bacterium]
MPKILQDKVAIISGSGRGLGWAFALIFAREGAQLLLPDINSELAELTAKEINDEGGVAVAIENDISDEKSVMRVAERAMQLYGRVDILVNNAALAY